MTNSKLPKDPHMLVSYVNMMLRDRYHSLTDFCEDNSVDPEEMIQKLSNAAYEYNETINQFR